MPYLQWNLLFSPLLLPTVVNERTVDQLTTQMIMTLVSRNWLKTEHNTTLQDNNHCGLGQFLRQINRRFL